MNKQAPVTTAPLLHLDAHDLSMLSIFDDQLLIACSGGIDSVVLLDQLCALRQDLPQLKLTIAHINFHLNETYATAAAELVQGLAEQYKLPLLPYDPYPLWQPSPTSLASFELWARQVKTAMIHLAQSRGMAVALAHHQDDVAETIIMRLLRGSQPWNLLGLARWRGGLFRPLLEITKERLITYAENHQLPWHEDPTNHTDTIHRGYIRHRILPSLTVRQASAREQLIRYAQNCKWLKAQLLTIMGMECQPFRLDLKKPLWIHSTLTLSLALELITGTELKMSLPWLRELLIQLRQPPQQQRRSYPIPGGTLLRQGDLLTWHPHPAVPPIWPQHYELYPDVAITIPLTGSYHLASLTLQAQQRCRLSLYTPSQFMAAASSLPASPYSPSSLKAIVQPFKRAAKQSGDICPEADLVLVCLHDLIILAISWSQIYRVHIQLPARGLDKPSLTYKQLTRGHHQWKLPSGALSLPAAYELTCTHAIRHQPDVVAKVLKPESASPTHGESDSLDISMFESSLPQA